MEDSIFFRSPAFILSQIFARSIRSSGVWAIFSMLLRSIFLTGYIIAQLLPNAREVFLVPLDCLGYNGTKWRSLDAGHEGMKFMVIGIIGGGASGMAAAIAATKASSDVLIQGADCVSKSYPTFWEEYRRLGGNYEQYLR